MKPVQYCTGFIFCTIPVSVTANKELSHQLYDFHYFIHVCCHLSLESIGKDLVHHFPCRYSCIEGCLKVSYKGFQRNVNFVHCQLQLF